jgi:hypothetical protein
MAAHRTTSDGLGYPSDRRRDYYSQEKQSGKTGSSIVPGQENLPKGLNESYYIESAVALGIPVQEESRAHSVPPQTSALIRRPRSPSISSSRSSSSDRGRSFARYHAGSYDNERTLDAATRTRGIIQNNFSQTRAGIGAGIVGAVVGGLIAKQASETAFRRRDKQKGHARRHSSDAAPRIASTVFGAVVGALGANAITHKLEDARERNKANQLAWESQYDRGVDRPYYDDRPQTLEPRTRRGHAYDTYDYERNYSKRSK